MMIFRIFIRIDSLNELMNPGGSATDFGKVLKGKTLVAQVSKMGFNKIYIRTDYEKTAIRAYS